MKTITFCVSILLISRLADSAKILGVWFLPGRSHFILGSSLTKGLAEMGHDVTLVSPFHDKDLPKNITGSYREVVLEDLTRMIQGPSKTWMRFFELNDIDSVTGPVEMAMSVFPLVEAALRDPRMVSLLNSGEKFDVVIVENFMNDVYMALAPHFGAHLVVFSSMYATSWVNDLAGKPSPVSYIPEIMTSFPATMSFRERAHNMLLYVSRRLIYYMHSFPRMEKLRRRYLPDTPSVSQLSQNVSLVLLNSHDSYSQPVPLTPNMIPIGGYHIKPPKKLPTDLQQFLDGADEGVVYFSMGSNLRSADLSDQKRVILMKVFSKLKHKVLWKFEEDDLPGKPKNVEIRKWLPQSDLLAHKNIKLFITHGGILSTSEAVYHGVPLLSIPVFGDQVTNAIAAETAGYALRLNFHDANWSEERLSHLLDQLLNDPKYIRKAKMVSKLFHDRPMNPMQTLDYWVKYVVRTNGAHHLRVLGTYLPWYQYYLVDVIMSLVVGAIVVFYIAKLTIKTCFGTMNRSKIMKKEA